MLPKYHYLLTLKKNNCSILVFMQGKKDIQMAI